MMDLYINEDKCCGCEACCNVCPRQAITMKENRRGFVYPSIDEEKCINCGLCKSVCIYQNEVPKTSPLAAFAAATKSKELIKKTASGGFFSVCAEKILRQGGVVYGAAFTSECHVRHIRVDAIGELWKLQGSKYVQSEIGNSYKLAKNDLQQGKTVLFSGTPCQIAGLKNYLKKEYDNLYTIDLICHGVPSQKMFLDYVATLSSEKIEDFVFRDKTRGWKDFFLTWKEKNKRKRLHNKMSSYYRLFLTGEIYRESCYSCHFACMTRVSDITLGDFWGFEKVHPEKLNEKKWRDQNWRGISCVLANTNKGIQLFDGVKPELYAFESSPDKIAVSNGQLKEPSKHTAIREQVLDSYEKNGYRAVDQLMMKKISKKQCIKSKIQILVPLELRIRIKNSK